jgi:tetratricopeptide (TPR) repeat protein
MCYNAKADALTALGKISEAKKIADRMLDSERMHKTSLYEAMTLDTRAQIYRAQHDENSAIGDLNGAIAICQREGYDRALIVMKIELADIYRSQGALQKAEELLASAAAGTQRNGEVYTLPERLRVLAEVQTARGNFAAADRTYDRAAAFVDSNIGNDSAVLDKTAWIKSVSDLYVAHFGLRRSPEQPRQSIFRRGTGSWSGHD